MHNSSADLPLADVSAPGGKGQGGHAMTVAYLDALLGRAPQGHGVVVSGTRPGTPWGRLLPYLVTLDRVPEAAADLANLTGCNVYVSVATMTAEAYARVASRSRGRRGGADDMGALTCLWADLDIAEPGHHSRQGLPHPPTLEAAYGVLAGLPAPTFTTSTGGGLHAYWCLAAPLVLDTPENRQAGAELAAGWVAMIARTAASRHGWHVDAGVGDLPRVLRVVGTYNNKTATPRRVGFYTAGQEGPGLASGRPWLPTPVYEWRELANIVAANTPAPEEPTPTRGPTTAPARRERTAGDNGGGLGILDAVNVLPWSEVWPTDWSYVGHETVKGQTVELWKRPGRDVSPVSAKCWPDGGCRVWSDNADIPAGKYSRAEVYAWSLGYGLGPQALADLSRALITAGRGAR